MRQKNWAKPGDRSLDTDSPQAWQQPQKVRVIAWFTILLQLLFPLSLSFTPAIAALSAAQSTSVTTPTFPYVLGVGENVNTIAKKHGLSLTELKNLNRYRTFAKPFAKLTAGDEIDIPTNLSPFSADHQSKAYFGVNPSPFSADRPADTSREAKLAGHAITAAGLLSSENAAKSAEQLAISTATSELNSSAQRWLNQFGTARVQLNINDKFQLENSSIDVLLPLFENKTNLLFTQLGTRYKDDRITLNAGVGVRFFQHGWMYGVNSFYDDDITGHNRRAGIGAEVWTDYLKLSANSYLALSDWRQSRDDAGYNERPASGYDVRAEAYLPVYPQLGGKLMFEQYYGDEVALFGKDNRQKDPYAFTAGVSYTPVPLVTLSAEHRAGKSGSSDSSVNLQFNYHFGESWKTQIDPSAVAASRKLAGSRHDLVERNNNIVLDYQKRELIRLSLPEQISGESTTMVSVNAEVTTKYPLSRIEWDSSALAAAGGQFTQVTPQTVNIKLPPYQQTNSTNLYTLSAVAYDSQGNSSSRASMVINVTPSRAGINEGNLTLDTTDVVSDGVARAIVEALVTDLDNLPVAEQEVTFSADNGASVETLIGITGADGIARAAITNKTAGITHVTAMVNGKSMSVDVNFIADSDNLGPTHSIMNAEPAILVANGEKGSLITLILKDVNGNLVSGQKISFTTDLANSTVTEVTEQASGEYTATMSGTTAGLADINVKVNGELAPMLGVAIRLIGDADKLDTSLSTLTPPSSSITADGETTSTIKFELKDINGNPVGGQTIDFASSPFNLTFGSVEENPTGVYTVTYKGTTAGVADITVNVNGEPFGAKPINVELTADSNHLDASKSTITASVNVLVADGTAGSTITFTLNDQYGNPVKGQTVSFTSSLANSTMGATTDNTDGTYEAVLTGTQSGETTVTATVGSVTKSITVQLTGDASTKDVSNSELSVSPASILADGLKTSTITFKLKDANDNPIAGQTVSFVSTPADVTINSVTESSAGVYQATVKGTVAGEKSITVKIDGVLFTIAAEKVELIGDSSHLDASKSTIVASVNPLVANGTAGSTITFTLKDQYGNPVKGQTVSFTSSLANSTMGATTDKGNGTYEAILTGTQAGDTTITATTGSITKSITVQLTGDASTKNVSNSELSVSSASILADGLETSTITLKLKDVNNNPIAGQTVSFVSTPADVSINSVTESSAGVYQATVKGTVAGDKSITVKVGGVLFAIGAQTVELTADSGHLDASKSTIVASVDPLVASGTAGSTITFTLNDQYGNPVKGQTVSFTSSLANSMIGATADKGNGTYEAVLKGTQAGSTTITATTGSITKSLTVKLIGDASTLTVAKSSLSVSPSTIVADNTATATVTFVLGDKNGNPVSGQAVTFVSNPTNVTFGTVVDNNGTYTATIKGTQAGTKAITVKVGANTFAISGVNLILTADISTAQLLSTNVTVTSDNAQNNGVAQNRVEAKVVDANGNPISGVTVNFSAGNSAQTTTVNSGVTNAQGIAAATFTNMVGGASTVTVTYGTYTVTKTVTFITLAPMYLVKNTVGTFGSGFPSIGFVNAEFALQVTAVAANNTNYTWTSDQSWVTVDASGNVKMVAKPATGTNTVTITALSKTGGAGAKYTFSVGLWFTKAGATATNMTPGTASGRCTSIADSRLPTISEVMGTAATPTSPALGSLYGEWKQPTGFHENMWSSTPSGSTVTYGFLGGSKQTYTSSVLIDVACVNAF